MKEKGFGVQVLEDCGLVKRPRTGPGTMIISAGSCFRSPTLRAERWHSASGSGDKPPKYLNSPEPGSIIEP